MAGPARIAHQRELNRIRFYKDWFMANQTRIEYDPRLPASFDAILLNLERAYELGKYIASRVGRKLFEDYVDEAYDQFDKMIERGMDLPGGYRED